MTDKKELYKMYLAIAQDETGKVVSDARRPNSADPFSIEKSRKILEQGTESFAQVTETVFHRLEESRIEK